MSIKTDVLNYLKEGHTLSGLDGFKLFSTLSVRNRIGELRKEGYNIQDKTVYNETTKKHYSVYWLVDEPAPTEHESAVVESNLKQEEKINYSFVGNQAVLF